MTSYPVADDEASRLQALRGLEIVGTKGTEAFGIVAQLAANAFVCPISYISLIDEDRQWFKAEYGLGMSSTSRDAAFCNYTILGSKVFVVEDALRDEPRTRSWQESPTSASMREYPSRPTPVTAWARFACATAALVTYRQTIESVCAG
jgi:GAF domain-containing protein